LNDELAGDIVGPPAFVRWRDGQGHVFRPSRLVGSRPLLDNLRAQGLPCAKPLAPSFSVIPVPEREFRKRQRPAGEQQETTDGYKRVTNCSHCVSRVFESVLRARSNSFSGSVL